MNAAIGLDPAIRPGTEVAALMSERIDWVVTNYPKLMTKMTKLQLREVQTYIVNAWVQEKGIAPMEVPTNVKIQPLPKDLTKQQVMELRDLVTNP
jgi:hypothetical protein